MATLAESNKRMEEEKSLLIDEKSKLELQVSEQREQIKRLERELSSVKDDADEIEMLKKKCVEINGKKRRIYRLNSMRRSHLFRKKTLKRCWK